MRVQRMIQRLGETMSEVSGFDRFLQNRDEELQRMVSKQEKRKKQVNKWNQRLNDHAHSPVHQTNPSMGSSNTDGTHTSHGRKCMCCMLCDFYMASKCVYNTKIFHFMYTIIICVSV